MPDCCRLGYATGALQRKTIVTALRSLLFIPGNKENMLAKAAGLQPDVFVPDMEDSVSNAEKDNARKTIRAFLPKLAQTGAPIIPRVNSLDSGWLELDLAAVIETAARYGKMLELNANPARLDLNDVACRAALQLGVPIVISTDAHRIDVLDTMRYGVLQARRG